MSRFLTAVFGLSILVGELLAPANAAAAPPVISAARQESEFLVHDVESEYQARATQIRVLLPEKPAADRRLPVIYVLPVEAGIEHRYGDGLAEVKKLDLHNKHQAIFVAPTFSQLPWYADHPTDPKLRQETYFLEVVIPFIEKTYSVKANAAGRLLLGFSKSGYGAWSLLLRHPDTFARAAAWDAPLMLDKPGKYGSGEIFGDDTNFEKYRITRVLHTSSLGADERLLLSGYGGFRADHQRMHERLSELRIPHAYLDGPDRKHDWHSGWVSSAVEFLVRPAAAAP